MKTAGKYLIMTIAALLMITMSSCDDKDEIEYNLTGTWYTSQEIDYGVYTWGEGTVMSFNDNRDGTITAVGDRNFLVFRWRWMSGYRYDTTMELRFTDGSYAYIEGADATYKSFSGTWYNSIEDFEDHVNGQYFRMRRAD